MFLFRAERDAWIKAKYVEKRFVSKIRPRRLNSAARKFRRKHPIRKFPDGKIGPWSAKKGDLEASEIARTVSDGLPSKETDNKQKEAMEVDSCDTQNRRDPSSPNQGSESNEDKAQYTPSLAARCQIEQSADSTSSDECETEEEMRSLPPNQVAILMLYSIGFFIVYKPARRSLLKDLMDHLVGSL